MPIKYAPVIVALAIAIAAVCSSLPYLKDAIRVHEIVEHAKNQDIAATTQEIADFANDTLTREAYGAVEGIHTEIVIILAGAFVAAIASIIAAVGALFRR